MFTFCLPSLNGEGSITTGCEEEGWLISLWLRFPDD